MTPVWSIERARLGWPAALVDLLTAVVCLLVAYRFRFEGPDYQHFLGAASTVLPVFLAGHLLALASVGVYRRMRLWPVRLIVGTLLGVAIAVAFVALDAVAGVSRQALTVYAVLFAISSLGWRAATGLYLQVQRQRLADEEEPGLEVRGAQYQSLGGGLVLSWQYRHLLRNLVVRDLQLKYRGSVLGFLWSLVNPLVMIGIYNFAFKYVMAVQTPRYASFVLIGVLTWGFFAGAVLGSTASIAASGSLLHSVLFPRIILPIAGVLFNLAQFLLTIVVFLPVLFLTAGVMPGAQVLLFPVFLLLQVMFIMGAALVLSTATTYFRDVQHLVEVGLNVAFWATPILYEYTLVPERFRFAILLSPMAPFIRAYQDIFHYGTWPDGSIWLLASAYGIGMFVAGLSVFTTYEDDLAEQV